MNFVLQSGDVHDAHDPDWTLYSPHYQSSVCLGCIMEILENANLQSMMKKPALTEMLRLLTHQGTEVIQLFMHQEAVVWLLQNILMENLCIQEESYLALSIDTLVKLVQQVGAQDLVAAILDSLTQQVDRINEPSQLLPQYTLIGKMLHQLPGLGITLLTDYDVLLHQLSLDLCGSGEVTQSAIAYNFIYLCDSSCIPLWTPRLIQQVHTGVLKLLSSAVCLSVQINGLGLLKKVITCELKLDALMSLTIDGTSVLSAVKKLLLTKKDVLQIGVCQVLSTLLMKQEARLYGPMILESDIAEFLFEALHTQNIEQMEVVLKVLHQLSSLDLFYKRCHAVYGMESVMHGLNTAREMNHPVLLKQGFILLAEILNRQPAGIPLFVSGALVQRSLQLLHAGHTHYLPGVKDAAQHALAALLRKEHLLLPVPFSDLLVHISMVTERVWSRMREVGGLGPSDSGGSRSQSGTEGGEEQVLEDYLHLLIQASRLGIQCQGDQTVCESTFTAPDSNTSCSLTDYIEGLLQLCDEAAIPLIMMCWDKMTAVSVKKQCMVLLCQLHDLHPSLTSDLLYKMVDVGFIGCVLEAKVTHYDPQMTSSCLQFLYNAVESCQVLGVIPRDVAVERLMPEHTLKWSFHRMPGVLQDVRPDLDTVHVYLLLLYVSYKHHNRVLSEDGLARVITCIVLCPGMLQLSHLGKKHLLFLLAYATVNERMKMKELGLKGIQDVTDVLTGQKSEWYTHDIVLLQWCCTDPELMVTAGYNLLEAYLESSSMEELHQQLFDGLEGRFSDEPGTQWSVKGSPVLLNFCQHAPVRHRLLLSMATQTPDLVSKLALILEVYIDTVAKVKESDSGDITLEECSNSAAKDRHNEDLQEVTEVLLNVFLKNIKPSLGHNISALLDVFVACRKVCTDTSIDIKLLCHVIHQLTKKESPDQLKLACLNIVHSVVTCPGPSEHQVCALVVQNEDLVSVLQDCVGGRQGSSVFYVRGCDIVAALLLDGAHKVGPPTISLSIARVLQTLWHGHQCEQVASLNLLTALFQSRGEGSLVKMEVPYGHSAYRNTYICLQQLLLHTDPELSEKAMCCSRHLVRYLLNQDHALGRELLEQPWNTLLVETVLDQGIEARGSRHLHSLLALFTEHTEGSKILRSVPDVADRVTRVLESIENTDSQEGLVRKLQTVLSLVTRQTE